MLLDSLLRTGSAPACDCYAETKPRKLHILTCIFIDVLHEPLARREGNKPRQRRPLHTARLMRYQVLSNSPDEEGDAQLGHAPAALRQEPIPTAQHSAAADAMAALAGAPQPCAALPVRFATSDIARRECIPAAQPSEAANAVAAMAGAPLPCAALVVRCAASDGARRDLTPAGQPAEVANAAAAMAGAPLLCPAADAPDTVPDTPTSSAGAAAPFPPGASLHRHAVEAAAAAAVAEGGAVSPSALAAPRTAAAMASTRQPAPHPSPDPDAGPLLDQVSVPHSWGPQELPAEGQGHAPRALLQPAAPRAAAVGSGGATACKRKAGGMPGGAGERAHKDRRGSGGGGRGSAPMSVGAPPLCDGQRVRAWLLPALLCG